MNNMKIWEFDRKLGRLYFIITSKQLKSTP